MNTPKTDALASMIRVKALSRPETYNPPIWEHARQLETQVNELREALEKIAAKGKYDEPTMNAGRMQQLARAILEKTS